MAHGIKLYHKIAVEDNGFGIPDDRKTEIISRFNQRDFNSNGIGTGLYIVRSLTENYGGYVQVEHRVKGDHTKGARFVVLLPAIE